MSNTTKITKKVMFSAIADLLADNADVVKFCNAEIALLDKRADKERARAQAKRANDPLLEVVANAVGPDYMSIADIVAAIDDESVTAAKVAARLSKLIDAGKVEKEDATIDKRRIKVYRTIQAD